MLGGRLSSVSAEAAATGTEDPDLAPATTPSLGQLVSGAMCSGDRVMGSPVSRGPGTRGWQDCPQREPVVVLYPGQAPGISRVSSLSPSSLGSKGAFLAISLISGPYLWPPPHGCVTADDRVCSVVKGSPHWDPQGMASGIGQNWGQVLRGNSQGQEKADPVLEASRQPHGAKVLYYHGQQVPWTGHRGQGLDRRGGGLRVQGSGPGWVGRPERRPQGRQGAKA